MAVTTANEPWKALRDVLEAQSSFVALMTGGVAQAGGADFTGGFPCFRWRLLGDGMGDTDAENHLDKDCLLQFDVWCSDDQTAKDALALLDDVNDYCFSGVMDTTHWKIVVLRRESPWRAIATERQDATGNRLTQWTADWRYKFRRKQNVA